MYCLHRGDNSKFSKAGNVIWMKVLRMLNPKAMISIGWVLFERCLVTVQYFVVGSVADGMRANLVATL